MRRRLHLCGYLGGRLVFGLDKGYFTSEIQLKSFEFSMSFPSKNTPTHSHIKKRKGKRYFIKVAMFWNCINYKMNQNILKIFEPKISDVVKLISWLKLLNFETAAESAWPPHPFLRDCSSENLIYGKTQHRKPAGPGHLPTNGVTGQLQTHSPSPNPSHGVLLQHLISLGSFGQ